MKPVKRKEIIEKLSQKLDLPEELVDEVVSHYYQTIQKTMSSMEHMGIYVASLGTFVLKKRRLENKIVNHEKLMQDLGTDMSMVRYDILMKKKENLERMKLMLDKMNEQEVVKKEYKDLRKNDE